MPEVLVTAATVMQNSPFSSLMVAVAIASSHFAYSGTDGQAELARVAGLYTNMVYARTVTHPSINRARRRASPEQKKLSEN